MARTTSESKPTTDDEAQDVIEGVAPTVAEGLETEETSGMKAYRSDRNLAEVNAGVTVWMDPKSEVGARLLATGYFTEVDEPQA